MKFVHCKRLPHKDWGVNDPINLEHCLSYSEGTAEGDDKEKASAIHFTMVGRPHVLTWTFVDERHCHWELGRLQELTYEPNDSEKLAAILATRGKDVLEAGPTDEEQAIYDFQKAGAAFAETLVTGVARLSEIRKGFVDRVEPGQRG